MRRRPERHASRTSEQQVGGRLPWLIDDCAHRALRASWGESALVNITAKCRTSIRVAKHRLFWSANVLYVQRSTCALESYSGAIILFLSSFSLFKACARFKVLDRKSHTWLSWSKPRSRLSATATNASVLTDGIFGLLGVLAGSVSVQCGSPEASRQRISRHIWRRRRNRITGVCGCSGCVGELPGCHFDPTLSHAEIEQGTAMHPVYTTMTQTRTCSIL